MGKPEKENSDETLGKLSVNNDSLDWHKKRIQALEEQRLEIIKLLNDCETNLITESDPQIQHKLEKQITHCKERLNACQEEIQLTQSQQNLQQAIDNTLPEVTFEDLDFVITALLNLQIPASASSDDFSLTDPPGKMSKNELTQSVRGMLVAGLAQAREVNYFIQSIAKMSFPNVPEKLVATLRMEYLRLKHQGVKGDKLFMDMYDFVSRQNPDPRRKIAGLAVLCYFFQTCEVFEP